MSSLGALTSIMHLHLCVLQDFPFWVLFAIAHNHLGHAFRAHFWVKRLIDRSIDHFPSQNLIKERFNRTECVTPWPYDLAAESELPSQKAHQWGTVSCLLGRYSECVLWWPRTLRQSYPGFFDDVFESSVARNRSYLSPFPGTGF